MNTYWLEPDINFQGYSLVAINEGIKWYQNGNLPRQECFMSDLSRVYTYGKRNNTYESVVMSPIVSGIMKHLNTTLNTNYDVCVCNKYQDESSSLGWHSDDSVTVDNHHPIASVSFGSEREIWVRNIGDKGEVAKENRFLLSNGSVFTMGAGMQRTHQHRIPKHPEKCGQRISLTFRKWVDK